MTTKELIARLGTSSLVIAGVFSIVCGVGAFLIGLSPVVLLASLLVVLGLAIAIYMRRTRVASARRRGSIDFVISLAFASLVALALMQLLPGAHGISHPKVNGEPAWATPRIRALMVAACYDCHSNLTKEPWYAKVAPMSLALNEHVDEGRSAVNYTEWNVSQGERDNTIEVIRNGSMPPAYYTRFGLHPEMKLTAAEVQELLAGLAKTPGM